jgi:endonuclease/exonuclease/phosphatase family metal-dependent hydrolase
MSIRVLTFNLWGRNGDWPARRAVIRKALSDLPPDLIAFQESYVGSGLDQIEELVESGFHVIHQQRRAPAGMGVSIASRHPLKAVYEIDLHVTTRTDDFPSGALIAEVASPDPVGSLLFVNYFPSWQLDFELERERQAVAVARRIIELIGPKELHVVLAGDLDADPSAASTRFWTGRQSLDGLSVCYRDAWKSAHPKEDGETFTPANPLVADWDWPFRRIDYILVRCGEHGGPTLKIVSCSRWLDEPVNGVWASDHFGLLAELESSAAS